MGFRCCFFHLALGSYFPKSLRTGKEHTRGLRHERLADVGGPLSPTRRRMYRTCRQLVRSRHRSSLPVAGRTLHQTCRIRGRFRSEGRPALALIDRLNYFWALLSICARPVRPLCKPPMLWRSPAPVRHPPGFIEPCLPTLGHAVPSGPQWAYEIKHDGFRFICRRDGDRVRVFSRRGNDYTDRVPRIATGAGVAPGQVSDARRRGRGLRPGWRVELRAAARCGRPHGLAGRVPVRLRPA